MRGGGIYTEGAIDLTNCVISGNKSGDGGGVYLFASPSASLVNCTLVGNGSYSNGGALASHASTIAMANTVIWNNVARTPGRTSYLDASFSGSVPTFFHCLVENHELGSDGFNLDGADPINAPLFFATPDPFSAPHSTGDLRVPINSPLVGAGSNLANPTERDIAGNSRISQGTIDIGAFEATQGPAVISPLPGLTFPIDIPSQPGVADLSAVFDASARSFAVESVFPEGRFDASIGGSLLGIESIAGHSLGLTQIIVAASTASGTQTFYGISVRIVGERLYVRAGAAPGGNGSSWGQAMVYLQDALDLADRLDIDEIWVAAGRYYPDDGASSDDGDNDSTFGLKSGQRIYGGFAGSETEFDQRNVAANRSLLSGDIDQDDLDPDGDGIPEDPAQIDGPNAENLFELIGVGPDTVVDGFTLSASRNAIRIEGGSPVLRNSTFIGNAGAFEGTALLIIDSSALVRDCRFGRNGFYAGVVNRGGAPEFVDCEFFGATGFADAGAIKNRDSSPSLIRCQFVGNTAKQRGAAIFNRNSSIRIQSCTFDGNMANWRGGAIFDEEGSSTTAIDCVFINNSGQLGGGALFSEEDSSLTLIGCNLISNSSSDVGGGALFSRESAAVLDRCRITGNSAPEGGAVVAVGSQISMSHCILSDNSASGGNPMHGGAIEQSNGEMRLSHCVVSGNSSGGEGGAACVDGILRLDNCTVTGNQAADRGGAFNVDFDAELHLTNSIVWNNQSLGATDTGSASIFGLNRTTASNSLVENIDLSAAESGNLDGTNPLNDPDFIAPLDPASAPSPAGDLRLQPSSPVIDRGDNTGVSDLYDLDSSPRIRDGDMDGSASVDLGAFEFQPSTPADFASLFPGLEPGGDTNLNGRSNFVDYAAGADPTASGEMFSDSIAITADGDIQFSFFRRIGTLDIDQTIERARSLQQQDWIRLLEHIDYRLVSVDMLSPEQQLITVEILTDLDLGEEHFFRQRLESQ